MPETRRFLRYAIPGLVFVSEALVYLGLLAPITVEFTRAWIEGTGLGVAALALLVSAGLGYLFSVAHHELHWLYPKGAALDYRELIAGLAARGHLTPRETEVASKTREAAWIWVTSTWNQRIDSSRFIKGADPKVMAMTDLVHATGTAFVANVAATLGSFLVAVNVLGERRVSFLVGVAVAAALVTYVHWRGYKRTTFLARGMIEKVLADALDREIREKQACEEQGVAVPAAEQGVDRTAASRGEDSL